LELNGITTLVQGATSSTASRKSFSITSMFIVYSLDENFRVCKCRKGLAATLLRRKAFHSKATHPSPTMIQDKEKFSG